MNQWKPTPPLEQIEPHIRRMWKAQLTDKQILAELRRSIDTTQYGIGLTKLVQIRKNLGLKRTREQKHTPDSIRPAMMALRATYPTAGAREMVSLLFHEWDFCVSRNIVREYFAIHEPELVKQRKAGRLQRRRFWAAGVNDIWAVDQHDKWLCFGLALHTGIEPFSGRILWMRIWHSNRNPQLILSYYLQTVRDLGFIPLVTQSDLGTENFGIANAQTLLRQIYDPALSGYIQHRWMRAKKNVTPEIAWSQLRRRFTPGFENILNSGVESSLYDADNTLQRLVFQWLFIPWLQQELDAYVDRVNNTSKRRDRNKVLPHGVPILIHTRPEDYGVLNFKVIVTPEALDSVCEKYINPTHPVFELVPAAFNTFVAETYDALGSPPMSRTSAWDVYQQLLTAVQARALTPPRLASITAYSDDLDPDNQLEILPDLQELPFFETATGYYMGGVGGGVGLQDEHFRLLDELDRENEPDVRDDIDRPPALCLSDFSDEDPADDDDIDN